MPRISLLFISLFFFIGGIGNFIFADFLVSAMPTYLPFHRQLVYLAGFLEIVGAIGVLVPVTRIYAAYGLIALCVAVFPANINMAVNAHLFDEIPVIFMYLRLIFQALLIWFIWWSISHERISNKTSTVAHIPHNSKLENVCKEFISAFNDLLQWKWDDRYQTALAEFGVDNEEAIHSILERYFRNIWDNNTIVGAPSNVRKVIDEMGGLKAGQLLFTSDSIEDTFIYCLLWPWGNQKTISIRISPSYQLTSEEDKQQQIQQVKDWFGIKPMGSGWIKIDNNTVPAG